MDVLSATTIREVQKANCFDFLRYLFAFSLILTHFCALVQIDQMWFISGGMRVKAFFVITGFLVTYSLLRRGNLRSYALKRVVRIMPAYTCAILFCLCIGFWLTTLNSYDFLTSQQTWKYAIVNLLMLNWLEPNLPGVFEGHYMSFMNGSLWSMKQEMVFYAIVPILIWSVRRWDKKRTLLPLMLCMCLVHNWCNVQTRYFMFFFGGMTTLLFLDEYYRWFRWAFPFSLFAIVATNYVSIPYVSFLLYSIEPLTFAMAIVGIAYHLRPMNFLQRFDNVSYGLYLYHFPVIQTLIHFGINRQSISLCFILTLMITIALACLSWFLMEKPLINKISAVPKIVKS